MSNQEKTLFCDYCGDEMGIGVRGYREKLTCGKRECERWARDEEQQERQEAHDQLDADMGW